MPRSFIVFVAALVLFLVGLGPADARASLVSTSPADGSQIATAPPKVELTFSEDVGSGFVAVTAPDGSKVETSHVHISGARVTADVAASDQRGRYTVSYRVVSADGHPVSGTFRFTTTSGRAVTQHDDAPSEDAPTSEPFVPGRGTLLVVGLAIAALAIALILSPLTRQRRS